jgi:hypothetical protein
VSAGALLRARAVEQVEPEAAVRVFGIDVDHLVRSRAPAIVGSGYVSSHLQEPPTDRAYRFRRSNAIAAVFVQPCCIVVGYLHLFRKLDRLSRFSVPLIPMGHAAKHQHPGSIN